MNREDEARAALAQRRQEAREADARETRERYGAMAASRVSTPPTDEDDALVKQFADGIFHAGVRSPDSTLAVIVLREVLAGFRRQAVSTPEVEVREEWYMLGHPGWPGGIDFRTQKEAEDFYWRTPKLDGTRDGMRIMHRTIHRFPEYVPVPTEGEA